jgi:hypothetical protein
MPDSPYQPAGGGDQFKVHTPDGITLAASQKADLARRFLANERLVERKHLCCNRISDRSPGFAASSRKPKFPQLSYLIAYRKWPGAGQDQGGKTSEI